MAKYRTISYKLDIQSRKDKTDPKSEVGWWGAKSPEMVTDFSGLMQVLLDQKHVGVHELLIGDAYRPYADVDYTLPGEVSDDEFEEAKFNVLNEAKKVMERLFPNGEVMLFCASSRKKLKISGHFIVNGIFYREKAHIRWIIEHGCDMKKLHFDHQVYAKNRLMRIPLCSKPGQKRPLRFAEIKRFKDCGYIHYPPEDLEADLDAGLITHIEHDAKEQPVPDGFVAKEEDKEALRILPNDEVGNYTVEQVAAKKALMIRLIDALKPERANDRDGCAMGVWAIHRVARQYGQSEAWRELAHRFAKKTERDNYEEKWANDYYNHPVREMGVGWTRLREWADEDLPGWDAGRYEIPKCMNPSQMKKFDIELLKEKFKQVSTAEDWVEFKDAVVDYMNRYYTLIKWGKKPFIVFETFDVKDGERIRDRDYKDVRSCSIDFENKTMKYKIGKKDAEFCAFKCWMKHPKRNEKVRICFNPRAEEGPKYTDPDAYNLYDGLAITREMCKNAPDLTEDSPYLQHILKRWSRGDRALFNSTLNRFALQIQKPWVKHRVAIGLMSPEGSGKGLVLQPIFQILGKKYVAIPNDSEQILGKFNCILEGKLMVFLDELVWGGDKEREGALKRLTTETTIGLERKGIDPVMIDSPLNVVAASNEDWMAPSGRKGRRLEISELSPELAGGQTDETAAIIQSILDVNILSIAKFFYNRDISTFNPGKFITTNALRSQKIESMPPLDRAILTMLNRDTVTTKGGESALAGTTFRKSDFYDAVGEPIKFMNETKFWKQLKVLFPSLKDKRETLDGKKVMMVTFPAMDVLRSEWRKAYDDKDWPFDDEDNEE